MSDIIPNLEDMTDAEKKAALDAIQLSIAKSKEVQKQRIGENVNLVIDALKKIESDIQSRYDLVGNTLEKRVASIKDGKDGKDGRDGKNGKDGRDGKQGVQGAKGENGRDGRDGVDGSDGVGVSFARIDFDGSLVIGLSSGVELNVGEVVAPDLAERIKVITNGGGTSQSVLDTLASLQTQINNLIPSQTGNAGKYLTTNGTVLSWASVAGGLNFQGTWNASTNTPTLASGVGVNGYYYITATAGSTNLDGITDWQIGDWLIFNGTVWQKIDQSNLVTSVNGQTGAVSVGTVTSVAATAGTGITVSGSPITSSGTLTITNSAPDQTVSLTASTGISTSGTYPNFTITNSAPDQTVALTQGGTTTISGTYPNFTISSADQFQGTVTSVTGTSPVASSGGATPAISLSSGYGDTLNPYASKTANFVLAAPNGSAGVPTFRAVVAADIPTLNQDTTGTASNVTGTVAVANGGTGVTTSTGSGNNVLSTSPSLVTPSIGGGGANFSGSTSGTINLVSTAVAGSNTLTLPSLTGTLRTTTLTVTTFTSSSGTYTVPTGCTTLWIRMAGGGGGGGGGNSGGAGGAGGTTTFGSSLLTCTGGTGGTSTANGGAATAGAGTIASPAIGLALSGSQGSAGAGYSAVSVSNFYLAGGMGGGTPFAPGGGGTGAASSGVDGSASTGAGGGGGATANNVGGSNTGGGGGGGGGYVDAYITSPSATYSYAVGAGGSAGAAGSGTGAGGSGAGGVIYITEFY
jgi:hypothetical protein